jgi:hypothetical protein
MSLLNAAVALQVLDLLDRKRRDMLFVLAILNAERGYLHVAEGYAKECLALMKRIGTDSCAECAATAPTIEGVALPEFLHEATVRGRLQSRGVAI